LPTEITSKEEFEKLLPTAIEIRVVKDGDSAKIKIRTADQLYTFKTVGSQIDALTKGTKVPVVEY
jgi:hypothetical protein